MMKNPEAWATKDDMFNTPYIRADIVDELVELVEVLKMGTYEPYCECEKCKEVRTAIARLEQEE